MKLVMKKIFVAVLSLVVLGVASCEKFLTEVPYSELTAENSFVTETDWNGTLTAAYGSLQNLTTGFAAKYAITLGEFGTDEVQPFDLGWAAYAQLHYYTFSALHEFFDNHYVQCYDGIKRCNIVIDMPESAPVNATRRAVMLAEAKFLRGWLYFDLVKMYGGVSLWTSSSVDKDQIMVPRSTADQVYEQIVKDLQEAASILPESWSGGDLGRATSHAANAMLGRVYLQWGKPAEALTYLNKVYGKFRLYDNYEDIFDPAHKNEFVENIFEVQFKHSGKWGEEGSLATSYWGPRGTGGPSASGGGWGGFGASQYLYDSYEAGDKRKDAFFWTEYAGVPQTPPALKKFFDKNWCYEIENDDLNYVSMRYADVLLMISEAMNATGDNSAKKYDCLNEVRDRAGIKKITAADNLTKDQFAAVVLKERMLELCGERVRRFDLVRFGKLAEQMAAAYPSHGIQVKSHHNLYPIPQNAMDANDAITENNPGY